MTEREQLEQAIAHLEAQRAVLGDATVDASVAALREKLAAVEPSPLPEQQRKQVAVLLADVSGSTAMAESMDPEDVTNLMNALWERLDKVITDHGGTIDKHMGDAVMALWGAEIAREDDSERAIRAALAIQAELDTFRQEQGLNLAMRVGVNTGPVLLGEVGTTGEYTAMGDTVNTTSRLEHAAPVGSVLISHDTYRHVRGLFEVQPLEPLLVKGKAEPLQVYIVQRVKPRAFRMFTRGVEGIETRMIGREAQLQQLQDAMYAAIDGTRQVISVVGEAGVGKSRLLYEFENWLELLPERIKFFKGRASPQMLNLPYALIRDLVAFRFQMQESDPARMARQKLETGFGEVFGTSEQGQMRAHITGQLLGFDFGDSPHLAGILDDAQQLRDRGLIYLSEFFQATAAQMPTVVFLEDIHWADHSSLDVIDYLARTTADRRLLMVCLARPTLYERRPGWGKAQAYHVRLELQPLAKQDSRRLVEEILQKVEQVPVALRELVVSGAEGNPFYVEELIKMLIEDGVIVKEEALWHVEPTRLTAVRVPPTLTGVLQARLDSLPWEERAVLQRASVVGRRFWDSAVARIGEKAPEPDYVDDLIVSTVLSALRDKEMVFPQGRSAFAGTQEYLFKHTILREVTYESVLRRVRRVYHMLVAEWLIQHSSDRISEYAGLIADHLELAGEIERAAAYLRLAGERAAAQFASSEAANYFSRALDLTPETNHTERYALLAAREKVYDVQGKRGLQTQDLAGLERLAEALNDGGQRGAWRQAEVALRQAHFNNVTGDYPAASSAAQRAIHLAQTAQDMHTTAMGYLEWGRAILRQGDFVASRAQFEQALAIARDANARQVEAEILRGLGAVPFFQGDAAAARIYWEQALLAYREINDRRGESAALNNLGVCSSSLGDYTKARDYYEQALHIMREIGDERAEGHALINLGRISHQQGESDAAKVYYKQALRICRASGDRQNESQALGELGRFSLEHGDFTTAKAYLEQALIICQEIGDRQVKGWVLINLGRIFDSLNDYVRAVGYFEQALSICDEIGNLWAKALAILNLGAVYYRTGDPVKGKTRLERALEICHETGDRLSEGWALLFLGRVTAELGDYTKAIADHEQALRIYQEIGDRLSEGWGLASLGFIYHQLGDNETAQDYSQQALQIAQELAHRPGQADALTFLGHALAGLGHWVRAADAYRGALQIRRDLGQTNMAMEPLAGLARASLAQADLPQARTHVETILSHLEGGTLDGNEDPFQIYLTCYQVLCANQDPRAGDVLEAAHCLLQERAGRIDDQELKRSFLERVATRREIQALWKATRT